jgi:hypothetical protein
MLKLADVIEPAGIVTDAGTCAAAGLELLSITVKPEVPAAALSVTVPVLTELPPSAVLARFKEASDTLVCNWKFDTVEDPFVTPTPLTVCPAVPFEALTV